MKQKQLFTPTLPHSVGKWNKHLIECSIDELIAKFPVTDLEWAARHGLIFVAGEAAAILVVDDVPINEC